MESGSPRVRLSVMMFGQYFVLGAWAVTLATFLMARPNRGGLDFPASYAGWIYSTLALAGIISPLLTGFLADRFVAAQKLMGVCHLLGGALLGGAAYWCDCQQPLVEAAYLTAGANGQSALPEAIDRAFPVLFGLMLLHSFCYLSTLTLCNVVALRNLRYPQQSFGGVRLFGTVGWVAAGAVVGLLLNPISAAPLWLAAGTSVVMGLYCFFLPRTPPKGTRGRLRASLGLPALRLLEDRSFFVLLLCSLALAATQQFYGVYTNPYLTDLDIPRAPLVQTLAQVGEVVTLMLLPLALRRLGFKWVIGVGLAVLVVRNAMFATESPAAVIAGLPLQGVCYAFTAVVASMYVDRRAPPHLRASAQGLFTFTSLGLGTLTGNWFAARIVEHHHIGSLVAWGDVWIIPTVLGALIYSAFVFLFWDNSTPTSSEPAPTAGATKEPFRTGSELAS
jgi:nucleoside transporter